MKTTSCLTSACRYCHYYNPEGRRGGTCKQLGVLVQGNWKSCSLSVPSFVPYENTFKKEIVLLEHSLSLDFTENYPSIEASQRDRVLEKQPVTRF